MHPIICQNAGQQVIALDMHRPRPLSFQALLWILGRRYLAGRHLQLTSSQTPTREIKSSEITQQRRRDLQNCWLHRFSLSHTPTTTNSCQHEHFCRSRIRVSTFRCNHCCTCKQLIRAARWHTRIFANSQVLNTSRTRTQNWMLARGYALAGEPKQGMIHNCAKDDDQRPKLQGMQRLSARLNPDSCFTVVVNGIAQGPGTFGSRRTNSTADHAPLMRAHCWNLRLSACTSGSARRLLLLHHRGSTKAGINKSFGLNMKFCFGTCTTRCEQRYALNSSPIPPVVS
jgi:hypothetical protein